MPHLAPYQTGLWLAEYVNVRCQLCRIYRSVPQSRLLSSHAASSALNTAGALSTASTHVVAPVGHARHSWLARTRQRLAQTLSHGLLCEACHHSIGWQPSPFNVDIAAGITLPIQAATYYDYPIRQAIRAFKHQEDMSKLPLLLHAIRQLPRPRGCHGANTVILAMPTTEQRLITRGFDPVSILAAQLSKQWRIPLWHGVKRTDNTVSQQGLTRAERLSNLDNAFTLIELPPVKRVLLFDDVATTGASLQALARALCDVPDMKTSHIMAYALAHGSQ